MADEKTAILVADRDEVQTGFFVSHSLGNRAGSAIRSGDGRTFRRRTGKAPVALRASVRTSGYRVQVRFQQCQASTVTAQVSNQGLAAQHLRKPA